MRYYSSVAVEATLTAGITASATSIAVNDVTGFPISYPYTLTIDADNASKELVEVTAAVGTTLTVTRGIDGTSGVSHTLGAVVRHDHSARDFREPQEHIDASSDVHGVTGELVGATETQTITNKDLTDASNIFPSNFVLTTATQTLTNKNLSSPTNTFPSSLVTLTGTQTLTNKNLADASNVFPSSLVTLTGSQALTNKDLSSATNTFPTSLVTLTGTQTLTNKTLTSPTISSPTVTGGTFDAPTIDGGVLSSDFTRAGFTLRPTWRAADEASLPSGDGEEDGDLAVTQDEQIFQRRAGVWEEAIPAVEPVRAIQRYAVADQSIPGAEVQTVVAWPDGSPPNGFNYGSFWEFSPSGQPNTFKFVEEGTWMIQVEGTLRWQTPSEADAREVEVEISSNNGSSWTAVGRTRSEEAQTQVFTSTFDTTITAGQTRLVRITVRNATASSRDLDGSLANNRVALIATKVS